MCCESVTNQSDATLNVIFTPTGQNDKVAHCPQTSNDGIDGFVFVSRYVNEYLVISQLYIHTYLLTYLCVCARRHLI